jgi:phenylalanyl-tRNA synthetase beta chain
MKLSAQWIREFVDVTVDDRRLAEDLTSIGIAVEGISGDGANTVFEMEIGTNRPDAMNHYGVAREAAALYGLELKPIGASLQGTEGATTGSGTAFEIDIEDAAGCARYTAQMVRGVKITNSPEHIAARLALVDQRSINNAADASNYTLWEMGHPTHAFDLDLLQGGKIVVRRARPGETLKTLDGLDRKLAPEDLIIADAKRPVALAGVMGGFDTMITDRTKNILIESAWFDPVAVRKTARRHGLHTDASHRFERGADYGATTLACSLVAKRIVAYGGGAMDGDLIDAVARSLDQAPVVLRIAQLRRILGAGLEVNEVTGILKRLGFELVPEPSAQPEFSVRIPTWRLDVEREIDVVEEVARLRGYDSFPNTLPAFAGAVMETAKAAKDAKLRMAALALGYSEAVSLSFISHEDAETFSSSRVVELENPLSEEASLMRTSLLPGMQETVAYNLNRGTEQVRLFELGDIYEGSENGTRETGRFCLASTASALQNDMPAGGMLDKSKNSSVDVFRLFKGDVETLLNAFQRTSVIFDTKAAEYFDPACSARVLLDGKPVAQFGRLHASLAAKRKFRQDVFIGELFLDELYRHSLREVRYTPLPKFPSVERDFSFLFGDDTNFEKIAAAIDALRPSELRSFAPVEIFRGGSVPSGKYSVLLRANFQSAERTLREDEVADWASKIVEALKALGGTHRA